MYNFAPSKNLLTLKMFYYVKKIVISSAYSGLLPNDTPNKTKLHLFHCTCRSMQCSVYLHSRKTNVISLVNEPYVNEITLNEQNLYEKSCYSSELKLRMLCLDLPKKVL